MSGQNLSVGIWCGQNIFSNIKKLKNGNKKVKKLPKLINEVQKKKTKQKKQKVYLYAEKHRMCIQKIGKSKYSQKINTVTEYQNTQYFVLDK